MVLHEDPLPGLPRSIGNWMVAILHTCPFPQILFVSLGTEAEKKLSQNTRKINALTDKTSTQRVFPATESRRVMNAPSTAADVRALSSTRICSYEFNRVVPPMRLGQNRQCVREAPPLDRLRPCLRSSDRTSRIQAGHSHRLSFESVPRSFDARDLQLGRSQNKKPRVSPGASAVRKGCCGQYTSSRLSV